MGIAVKRNPFLFRCGGFAFRTPVKFPLVPLQLPINVGDPGKSSPEIDLRFRNTPNRKPICQTLKQTSSLRYLTLNFHSSIDIALIGLGLFSFLTAICGALTGWSDSLAIAWSISFSIKVLAGAAMIGATICSIGATGRIISAIAVGYCVCLLAYLNRIDVEVLVGVIVLLALLIEVFVSRRFDLRTSNLKDRLERNAIRVRRLVVIPMVPLAIFLAFGLAGTFRPSIETLSWRETEAQLVSTSNAVAQVNSQTPRYGFEVDGKSYLLLDSSDPQAKNSAFFIMHKGISARRGREESQLTQADNTSVPATPQAAIEKQPATQQSFAIVYNPNSPSDNAMHVELLAVRTFFGFCLILFFASCYLIYKELNGTRLQFIEPDPKFWSKKPYVNIADLPATAS